MFQLGNVAGTIDTWPSGGPTMFISTSPGTTLDRDERHLSICPRTFTSRRCRPLSDEVADLFRVRPAPTLWQRRKVGRIGCGRFFVLRLPILRWFLSLFFEPTELVCLPPAAAFD